MARQPSQSPDKQTAQINIPPHSIEAEQAVLGGIMLNNSHWENVVEHVITEDFYTAAHRLIFREMEELARQNHPIDLITLDQALKNKGVVEDVGGFAYLAELSKNTPSAANIIAYADIVREKAVLRELIGVGNTIAQSAYSPKGRDVKEILDEAEREVFKIAEKRSAENEGPENILNILERTIDKIEFLSKNQHANGGVTGVTTGFKDLDKKTAGLQPSDLIIVAARPSMGKTTFAMNLCENAALSSEKPVLIFSLEMPADQIMMRSLASLSRVDQTKIRTGQITEDDEWARISSTMGMLTNKPNMYIDDSAGLTPTELRSRARRVYRENGGLSLIMIDYLQLMRAPGFDNRTLEIAEISRSLKALAKELEVPVVALSQLNRTLENRTDKRPVNSDLRESGSIEQDADLIMFIYRDEVYHETTEENHNVAEIIIGKQRNGPIGRVRLTFQGQYSRFDNYAGGHQFNDDDY
ncbi:replicative DNA helicase [Basfia succiniciproducens]|uniref:Replicative DNA helicase n=1 Tax=Basfia succiniciproducens TaxID=653940 RepID=A0A1G5AE18_9PAST|nr:replicative DNA helicase [Basfia succiniciproducens]QIM68539.1 replicative DNA helicase [Basfia succiniciproducens]SCX76091.1 primary replicative DNA helicase [Basfia succiniciproducens]SEP89328.1 primary replicative DNA helicase [Basfia succiniciproducens]